jgi:uncharacterized secreted protein with C-terminal beta-propeller domain
MIGRPFWIGYQDAYAAVYDVSDPAKPVLLKNYEITGAFYSARLTGNELMLISNQYNIIVYAQDGKETINDPMVKETVTGSIVSAIGSKTAFALPGKSGDSFVNIMKVDLDTVATAKLSSYLGSIQTIFADKANLLIAQYRFVVTNQATGEGKTVTDILRFDINSLELKADASISGYLLNQFSFDIYANTVRVAATDWAGGKTTNSVYVFDMALEPQSSIMNLAAGETIRAVRFIEDKGYVVTFQNIDPLFVIDLSNPKAIKVTGELKIPGFSTYLHPLSKTVLFGIAEDLEVVQVKNPDGTVWNNMNRFGIKLSLFDVSDPTAPKELASLRVLGQNGYTEASYNHKTVVYDTERELLYLPYTDSDYTSQVCQTYPGKEGTSGTYTYCSYKMESGIKVVHVTKTGITLVKTIVVATNNDYTNLVSRVLYVGDKLFAITSDSVLIYDRDSYAPISTIKY